MIAQAFIQIIDSFDQCSGSTSLSNCQVAVLKVMRYQGSNASIQTRIHDKLKNALQPHWTSVSDLQYEVAYDLDLELAAILPDGKSNPSRCHLSVVYSVQIKLKLSSGKVKWKWT